MPADSSSADDERERLRQLGARLLELHATLLAWARRAHEELHGPISAAELLQLLLRDERFAWLRALSGMIARIDATLDADEPPAPLSVESFFGEAQGLLRSGGSGAFATTYAEALQDSPDVVMAHAEVVKVLPRLE
jgi:hypothetical protein